jgi:hypothetical protein
VPNVVPRLVDYEYVLQRTNRSAEIRPPKTGFLNRFRMPIFRELSPGGSHRNAEGKLGDKTIEEKLQVQRLGKKRSLECALHPWMDSGRIRLGVWLSALSLI